MNIGTLVLVGSILLFLASLTQDAYYLAGDNPEAWAASWGLLLIGWMGVYFGVFAWLANPLLLLSWMLFLRRKFGAAFVGSAAALLFALSFLLHSTIVASEAPTYEPVTGYGLGYWLWLASMLIMAAGTLHLHLASRSRPEQSQDPGR
jgi:hypothetical protein